MHEDGLNQIYHQGKLTFILTPEKIVVSTPFQKFYLDPISGYYNRRLVTIRRLIQVDEIRSLEELANWCSGGVIMWVATARNYTLEKPKALA